MMKLNRTSLETLKNKMAKATHSNQLVFPSYPSQVDQAEKIWLHVGLGNFHRAHQALCMQRMLDADPNLPWRIIGTSLRRSDTPLLNKMRVQDNLYTLIELSGTSDPKCEIIASHQTVFSSCDDIEKFIKIVADDKCKLITFTVTEGGYYIIESEEKLMLSHRDIVNDLIVDNPPLTIYGFLRIGLKARFEAGGAPLTLLSCDNVIGNGNILRMGLMMFLREVGEDAAFIEWIERSVSFPNSMVDRITPAFNPEYVTYLKTTYDYEDEVPVHAETFWQWVIEDNFKAERPPFEKGRAEIVSDVKDFEELKLRVLNAGHSSLAYRGLLLGYQTYDQVIANLEHRKFFDTYQFTEVLPKLQHLKALNPEKYLATVTKRFTNTQISDTLTRIGCDGMAKVPKFVLPTLVANLKTGGPINYAVEIIVNWASVTRLFLAGKFPDYHDGEEQQLRSLINKYGFQRGLLFNPSLWGNDVISHPRYLEQVAYSLRHGITDQK
ncbi:mannitol 2-dehydrogenase [Spirochaetota bacterium]|nr:mannitol 2-dehydrogenase [Spirochaetota bacterium]